MNGAAAVREKQNLRAMGGEIADFCRRHHIRKLSLFGSVLREDFRADSDVDVLVEFEPEHVPGLFALAGMARELSPLLGGRQVDLRTPQDLSPYFRDEVLGSAEVQYAQE
jgi:predicted nucleotidyltransferase